MAKPNKTVPVTSVPGVQQIDPDATYRVDLLRSVKYAGLTLSPRNNVTVKGRALIEIAAAVKHAETA